MTLLKIMLRRRVALFLSLATVLCLCGDSKAADWSFEVKFAKSVRAEPFTGRVYVICSKRSKEPRRGPSWFTPELFAAIDIKDLQPGETVRFNKDNKAVLGFPDRFRKLDFAGYRAQAVMRFNPHHREIGVGPGNGFSEVVQLPDSPGEPVRLTVNALAAAPKFQESKWTKLLDVRSTLLSKFHGRDVNMSASVLLPAGYFDNPDKRYPTIFTIPGFGGTHFRGVRNRPVEEKNREGVEFIRVILDPSCPRGHHVFADSANNGPVGQALIDELIPAFDKKFRSVAKPSGRFLTGHSSGGWSSLWVMVTYADHFAGTWSTAPDPVDFRDFQRVNIYQPKTNLFVDEEGNERPLARINGQVKLWYRGFSDMENVLGYGGQLHSFEAVFSPRGKDGTPRLMWDRRTGAIDLDVARTWEKYDIRLTLERKWKTLGPKLKGKLHVIMGDQDTFYLEGATIKLKAALEQLGSDAKIDIVPGKNHFNLLDSTVTLRIRSEMVDKFLENQ